MRLHFNSLHFIFISISLRFIPLTSGAVSVGKHLSGVHGRLLRKANPEDSDLTCPDIHFHLRTLESVLRSVVAVAQCHY